MCLRFAPFASISLFSTVFNSLPSVGGMVLLVTLNDNSAEDSDRISALETLVEMTPSEPAYSTTLSKLMADSHSYYLLWEEIVPKLCKLGPSAKQAWPELMTIAADGGPQKDWRR